MSGRVMAPISPPTCPPPPPLSSRLSQGPVKQEVEITADRAGHRIAFQTAPGSGWAGGGGVSWSLASHRKQRHQVPAAPSVPRRVEQPRVYVHPRNEKPFAKLCNISLSFQFCGVIQTTCRRSKPTPLPLQDSQELPRPSPDQPAFKKTSKTYNNNTEVKERNENGWKEKRRVPMVTLGGRLGNEKGKSGDLEKGQKKKAGNKDLQLHALSQASGFRFMLLAV